LVGIKLKKAEISVHAEPMDLSLPTVIPLIFAYMELLY